MRVPEGWKRRKLGNLLKNLRNGYVCAQSRSGEGLPISRIETISHGVVDPDSVGYAEIPLADRDKFKMQVGDILLSHINSLKHIGKSALYTEDINLYHGMNLMLLRAERGIVTPDFLHSILISDNARNHIRRYAKQAINQASVNKKDIAKMDVLLPPLPEQKKIAAILSSVDETIQATRKTIEQTKKVKQGLMQELLTRGIGHTRFKITEIGEIPEGWYACKLIEVVITHRAGIYKKKNLFGEGCNIVGVQDLYRHSAIDGQFFRRVPLTPSERDEYSLQEGDLIYGESSLVREGIARSLYVTSNGAGTAFAWHTRMFRLDSTKVLPLFIHYQLNTSHIRRKIMSVATQTALTGITTKDFFTISIAVPKLPEQVLIAERIHAVEKTVQSQESKLQQLHLLKKGLMQDLLTGKVRVAV